MLYLLHYKSKLIIRKWVMQPTYVVQNVRCLHIEWELEFRQWGLMGNKMQLFSVDLTPVRDGAGEL